MNKAELKQLLKPLIKECIKEVIFEDGVLSSVVSEVAKGLGGNPLVESATLTPAGKNNFDEMRQQSLVEQKKKLNDHRQQLMEAMGHNAYNGVNLFEGTNPLSGAPPKPGAGPAPQGPLAGVAPTDAGVDISNLFGAAGRNWKTLAGSGK
jgi:hypothetical protein